MSQLGYLFIQLKQPTKTPEEATERVLTMLVQRLDAERATSRLARETNILSATPKKTIGAYIELSQAAMAEHILATWQSDEFEFKRIRPTYPIPIDREFSRVAVGSYEFLPHIERLAALEYAKIRKSI